MTDPEPFEPLREALKWALREGQKGFYTVSQGDGTWYHCRFCHAVADNHEKLNHEDNCQWFHVKKQALAASAEPPMIQKHMEGCSGIEPASTPAPSTVEPNTHLSVPHDNYPISQEDLNKAKAIRDEFMGTMEHSIERDPVTGETLHVVTREDPSRFIMMPPLPPGAFDLVSEMEKQAQAISGFTGMQGDIAPQKQEQLDLLKTVEAEKWAAEWCRIAKINGELNVLEEWVTPIDEGWMTTWFANAIETGRSQEAHALKEFVANWMISYSFATGHANTVADLLNQLSWQILEMRRKLATLLKAAD